MAASDQQRIAIQIKLADALAEHALIDKVDKQGKPLIEHSRRVAAAVKHLSHEQHVTALLHDIVKETIGDADPMSITAIDALFGRTVGNMVGLLTRISGREYQSYIETVALFPSARAIKLADLNDNLDENRGPIEPSLKLRYEKARQFLIDIEREEKDRGREQSQSTPPVVPPKGNGK